MTLKNLQKFLKDLIRVGKGPKVTWYGNTDFISSARSTLVGQRHMKSLSSVCLSVHLSISLSLIFPRIGWLTFSDIAHDDSWPSHLITDKANFWRKNFCSPNLDPTGLNQVKNEVFLHFIKFGQLVFLELAHNDTLQQYLTSSRGKRHKTNSGASNLGQNWTQN